MVTIDEAIEDYKREHPSRWQRFKNNLKEKAKDVYEQRKTERQVFNEAYREARLKRMRHEGEAAGYGAVKPVYRHPGKPIYAKLSQGSDLGSIFNMGIPQHHPKGGSKTSGKQYVVVGGKAYEKAHTGSHKKKRRKNRGGSSVGGIPDFMNMKPW